MIVLGLDAGGTFTDAVVWDRAARKVLGRAKAPTTPSDYSLGLSAAIDAVDAALVRRAEVVSVSTTLATNALVTGAGHPAGVVLIGYPPAVADRVETRPVVRVAGAIDLSGRQTAALDEAALAGAFERLVGGQRVEALAISGYNSVMNPAHEQRAAELAAAATHLPIVQGHQLSMKLNAVRRATTAALNASLLPLIAELLDGVRSVLRDRGLRRPLYVVRGDGTLMSAELAADRPIETILSGPAASVVGAGMLGGTDGALVADIGGTTTDLARLDGKAAVTVADGAVVGGHRTHVTTVEMRTVGLGGDSEVHLRHRRIELGPNRVTPICALAAEFPTVREQLRRLQTAEPISELCPPVDFFCGRPRRGPDAPTDATQRDLLARLTAGPLPRAALTPDDRTLHPSTLPVSGLLRRRLLERAALTPTDCLVAAGELELGCRESATRALALYARRAKMPPEVLAPRVVRLMRLSLAEQMALCELAAEGFDAEAIAGGPLWRGVVHRAVERRSTKLETRLVLRRPVVAVGAPARAYAPPAARWLRSRCHIPPDADVANAVGAAASNVRVELTARIDLDAAGRYVCHSRDRAVGFETLDAARAFMDAHLREQVVAAAHAAGADAPQIDVTLDDRFARTRESAMGPVMLYVETRCKASAEGPPRGIDDR